MSSAQRLTEVNIFPKFPKCYENLSKGSGDMKVGGRNARRKHVTFYCDLGFGSAWFSYEFCRHSLYSKHLIKV